MMKRTLIYHLILLLSIPLTAQEIALKVEYPAVVSAGQQFSVSWSVNSGGGEFSCPPFTGFTRLMGPQTSYSSNTQIINGKMLQEVSYSYTYYLLANNEGRFVIPPAVFKVKNKTYQSDSIRIEVVADATGRQNQKSTQSTQSTAGATKADQDVESNGNNIFLNLALSRKELYIGEPIIASVKIYTRVNLSGINDIKYPSFKGFLRSDIETPQLTSLKQENVNGTIYGTGVVQQFILYPQVTGEINIDPVQISVLVQQKTGQSDPFFDNFFSSVQTVPRTIASKSLKVKVKSLPGVQPTDYSGVVGKLDLKANLSKETVNVNDAVNFKVRIEGSGNLKVAAAPSLKLSPDIEVYEPKISDDLKNGMNGTTGQKTFDYLIIPRHYGDYVIPSVTYSYFNTSTGKYESLSTGEFTLHVRKGNDQNTGITVYGGVSKEDVKYLGKDIRFIKTDPGNLRKTGGSIVINTSYHLLFVISLLIFLVVLFLRREHIRRNSDISQVRNRKAAKIAIRRLQSADECLKNEQIDSFYEEMLKALWGYLSDKLSIPVAELTRSNVLSTLADRGIDSERIESLNRILDTCEFARFAPSASGAEAVTIYEEASLFIKSVENSIG